MENRKILKNIQMTKSKIQTLISYSLIILLAVVARLIPHAPNFAPIGGLALFSGFHFKKKVSLLIPLLSMFISDIFLGFHSTIFYVYVSFVLITFIGNNIKSLKLQNLFFASILSSILFFLITNFGVWLAGSMYPKTISGLLQSYQMGLPFFRNTVFGDLIYSVSFFYGYQYISNFIYKKNLA
jgi:signal transduction histidine kinase